MKKTILFAACLGVTALVLPISSFWEIKDLSTGSRSLPLFEGLLRVSLGFGVSR